MLRISIHLIIGFSLLILVEDAVAQTKVTTTANCNRSATAIQAAVNAASAGVPTTITVSGACRDNVVIPTGKQITLLGASGSTLTPASSTTQVIESSGMTTLDSMNISSTSSDGSGLILAWGGGTLFIKNSDIYVSANANTVIGVWQHSVTIITNSRIRGVANQNSTYAVAVQADAGSSLIIKGDPASGANTFTKSYASQIQMIGGAASGAMDGIACSGGSSLVIRANSAAVGGNLQDGEVHIDSNGNSDTSKLNGYGIRLNQCDLKIKNNTPSIANITISGNSHQGILMFNSTGQILGATIQNNGNRDSSEGDGISINMGSLVISQSKINNNGPSENRNDVAVYKNSTVNFTKWDGTTAPTIVGQLS